MECAPESKGLECSGDHVRAMRIALNKSAPLLDGELPWYPLDNILETLRALPDDELYEVGRRFYMELRLPRSANIVEALYDLDIVYHLGHRRRGRRMFDIQTGLKIPGLGHILVTRVGLHEGLRVFALTPYPCGFSRGIVAGAASVQEPTASVRLEPPYASHVYRVRW